MLLVALSWVGLALCLCVPSLTTFIKIKDPIASARWLSWGAHCCGQGARSCWILPYIFTQDIVLPRGVSSKLQLILVSQKHTGTAPAPIRLGNQ